MTSFYYFALAHQASTLAGGDKVFLFRAMSFPTLCDEGGNAADVVFARFCHT